METSVFQSGNGQAVRVPKALRLSSKRVEIFRRGSELIVREKQKGMANVFDLLAKIPSDFKREFDGIPQKRESL